MSARVKKSTLEQLRPFWIFITLGVLAAAAAGYYGVTWRGFHAGYITVAGAQIVSRQDVLRKAAVRIDENLWLQNMHAAALRIESIPYVKVAALHRSLPASLQIIVTERTPEAVVVTDRGTALIDADGRVLESGGVYPVNLPRVRIHLAEPLIPGRFLQDPRIARVQRDYRLLLRNKVLVYALQFNKRAELTVQLRSGVTVELGEDADLAHKAALVDPILQQLSGKIEKVTALDLRAPRTPIVVYK